MYATNTRRPGAARMRRRPSTYTANRRPSGGRNNRRPGKQAIDPRRFIKPAVAPQAEVVYDPFHLFKDFPFSPELQTNLTSRGYNAPTPIQDQAILPALEKYDVLGIANTGTGKTAAFLLPLIHHTLADYDGMTSLILAPTRELALQIEKEFKGFAKGLRLGSAALIGGAPLGPQMALLRRDPHFVIGTPGRVKDMIKRGELRLSKFRAVVLDEVDRMLDMGFIDDIRMILQELPVERQSLFFSATLSPKIEDLIRTFMREPVKVAVRTAETSDNVEQDVVTVPQGSTKLEVLHDLLIQPGFEKVLIFGETKYGVERLSSNLTARGFKSTAIHGNKTQGQRNRAIEAFKRGDANVLVATDVAARGLDIPGVSHVINFDTPQTYDDYTHRIGRTGRAGKKGFALTFVD